MNLYRLIHTFRPPTKGFMRKSSFLLMVFITIKFLLQYLAIHPVYELHRDEFLHLDQGRHLAWGYFSVPPVTSRFSSLILLAGSPEWLVKFFPALFGALTIWVVWRTVALLGGGLYAQALSAVALLFSALLRINTLYQPNSLDILMWTLLLYCGVQYTRTLKTKWLYGAAICFAFGFLNKYNIGFLLAALLPSLLLTPQRRWFTNRHLYFAFSLAFLLVLPNLLWQVQNGFPVVYHMKELAATQLENFGRGRFLREQALFFLGSVYVLISSILAFWIYEPFRAYRFLFFTLMFTLLLFLYFKAKPYYAIGLYPIYMAFGAVYLEAVLKKGWKKYLRPVLLLAPAALFLPVFAGVLPACPPEYIVSHPQLYQKLGMLHWEDGKEHPLPQDFADMLGWKELASKVDSLYETLNDSQHTLVYCDNYGEAGAVNHYSRHKNINAVSMNADYINWFRFNEPVRNVLLVKETGDEDPERRRDKAFFEEVVKVDSITNPFARERGTTLYLLKNARIALNDVLKKEISKKKAVMKFH